MDFGPAEDDLIETVAAYNDAFGACGRDSDAVSSSRSIPVLGSGGSG